MTTAQKEWLDKNRGWEAVVRGRTYVKRALLHADGTTNEIGRGGHPVVHVGTFEVGVRKASA